MRRLHTSLYWVMTLGGAFLIQYTMGRTLLADEVLLQVFPYEGYLEDVTEFINSVMVLGLRRISLLAGLLTAAAYNVRLESVSLQVHGYVCYHPSNVVASLLCALLGSVAALYLLLMVSAGFTMLVVGGSMAWMLVPLLSMITCWKGWQRRIYNILQANAQSAVTQIGPGKRNALSNAFAGIFPWERLPFRLLLGMCVFTSTALAIFYLLQGPLHMFLVDAQVDISSPMNNNVDNPVAVLLKGSLYLTCTTAPYFPMISSVISAIGYEAFIVTPLCGKVHPALLLCAAPLVAACTFVMFLALMVAGVYFMFWYLLVGMLAMGVAVCSPVIGALTIARMIKNRRLSLHESISLQLIGLIGLGFLIMAVLWGGMGK